MELEKTVRMNILFSFYRELLTVKQAQYMADYYEEVYTLAEIAANNGVSRQAIYDSIKRTEENLLDYEEKLQLVEEFEERKKVLQQIRTHLKENYDADEKLNDLLSEIIQDTIREEN